MTATETNIDETKLTEQSTTEEAEMSDKDYLITLASQLSLGMDMDEVFSGWESLILEKTVLLC